MTRYVLTFHNGGIARQLDFEHGADATGVLEWMLTLAHITDIRSYYVKNDGGPGPQEMVLISEHKLTGS